MAGVSNLDRARWGLELLAATLRICCIDLVPLRGRPVLPEPQKRLVLDQWMIRRPRSLQIEYWEPEDKDLDPICKRMCGRF